MQTKLLALSALYFCLYWSDLKVENSVQGMRYSQKMDIYISPHKLAYFDALLECRTVYRGKLVTIYNHEEDEAVKDAMLQANATEFTAWTSGRYDYWADEWAWESDNVPVTYQNWLHYEVPSFDNCMSIAAAVVGNSYGWVSASCSQSSSLKMQFICQFSVL